MFFDTQHGMIDRGVLTVDRGVLTDRIYIDAKSEKNEIIKCRLKGAGFCSYQGMIGRIIGYILSLFGRAVKVKVGRETHYLNTKSFVHHILRRASHPADPALMHSDYLRYKSGLCYDSTLENKVLACFLKNVQDKNLKNIWELMELCLKEAAIPAIKVQEPQNVPLIQLPIVPPKQKDKSPIVSKSTDSELKTGESGFSESYSLENFDLTALRNFDPEKSSSEEDNSSFSSTATSSTLSSHSSSYEPLDDMEGDYSSMEYSVEESSEEVMQIGERIKTDAFKLMCKNAQLAITEHKLESGEEISFAEIVEKSLRSKPLTFKFSICSVKGRRKTMEDQYFFDEFPEGAFLGIFDGHGGADVADYASKIFKGEFLEVLKRKRGDALAAYNYLMHKIQIKICLKDPYFACQGSTAVLCYIDRATKLIYTATLGDSEAKIYSKRNDKIDVIPLSCVRNWASEEDKQRALKHHPHLEKVLENSDPKSIRIGGSNVSRALGDAVSKAVSQEPIVTVAPLSEGQTVILACDGYWDFVDDTQTGLVLKKYFAGNLDESLSQLLGSYALSEGKSTDNVTVMAVNVG